MRAPILTALQIFETMRRAGFPPVVAVTMTAIALRESAGRPDVLNANVSTKDRSYGLLQINMFGSLSAPRLALFGLSQEEELLDPEKNAAAGLKIWAGKNSNLDVAWYIAREGSHRDRYERYLSVAQAAALTSSLGV